ncbi:ABC transporter ATP-binding protein [Fervidicoccus fontis]|uniref:Daunorubicin resistance ATP-binding protein drrA n=2 Tax=Fervidicoccus fontis TaxID=683846 RepID=I0A2N5_FERFK|nr:ABC transporter ATP-binding protein [Fervidicoccus fontis]AFH43242.1 daunorubicin resistance ATP-binding protein drrA [Fervidicoccus fontis Kam940]MBE9390622.1 ABC transporter ATP-binding protein [Fervidicoccus fontis]PMB75774.1 MAG: spermidine/putrescine ABC transporter ATP-binding protein PotA [Fervidicoccus fontis]PMB76493.1 MAG: spermidine/putrescine ABC transporter ATP-binding protein PotA [Fervidicoccus fontis]
MLVTVRDLRKNYGEKEALKSISFNIDEGEIYGLIGPNGAGKSTTLRILATLLKPTSGEVYIDNINVAEEPEKVRKIISYLPEEAGAYPNMTGIEYLKYIAEIYGVDESFIEVGKEISGLGDALKDKIKTYSKGMKRRLQVARTLMVKPKLAILDEPTSGIDVLYSLQLRRSIKDFSKVKRITIILSSHNMLEVENLCDRVSFLYDGRLIVEGTPEEIKEKYDAKNLEEAFVRAVGI